MTETGLFVNAENSTENGKQEGGPDDMTDEEKELVLCEGDEDVADGFISQYLKSPHGSYTPRALEKECWGTGVDKPEEPDDQHDMIYQLITNTAPRVKWREGLFYILKETKSETSTRKCLTFLHSNAANGVRAAECGCGERVQMETNSTPKCLKCADWMTVMEGLNFDLTSPGTVRSIDHVDVIVGNRTDKPALTGFCHLLKALLEMSWTNLQTITRLDEEDGRFLHNTLALLCSGCGIDAAERHVLEDLENRYPSLMKCLGFRYSSKHSRLQWQSPEPDKEFRNLCLTLHGLFRSADNIESVL